MPKTTEGELTTTTIKLTIRKKRQQKCPLYLARRQYVVHVFQEPLVLDLVVGKDERDALALVAGRPVKKFKIIHQVGNIVRPEKAKIKTYIS